MEAQTQQEIEEIKAKIKIARRWAKKYFNSAQASNPRLVDENFNFIHSAIVEFPDVDKMRVCPVVMGQPMLGGKLWFEYRLSFNPFGWQGKHPIYGYELGLLRIEDES